MEMVVAALGAPSFELKLLSDVSTLSYVSMPRLVLEPAAGIAERSERGAGEKPVTSAGLSVDLVHSEEHGCVRDDRPLRHLHVREDDPDDLQRERC